MGSELVGVTVGEAQNPRKNVPRGPAFRILTDLQRSSWCSGAF